MSLASETGHPLPAQFEDLSRAPTAMRVVLRRVTVALRRFRWQRDALATGCDLAGPQLPTEFLEIVSCPSKDPFAYGADLGHDGIIFGRATCFHLLAPPTHP